jgi:hypothetical protein
MLQANASSRSFDVAYFSDLLDASLHATPLLGEDLMQNIKLLVPSVISADKFGFTGYSEEDMVNMKWGFTYKDEANTLLTAGVADFGIFGVMLYPLAAVFLLRFVLEWMQSVMPTHAAVIVALAFVHQMLLSEQLPAGYLLQIRNALIFMMLVYLWSILPRFRLRAV